jgi:large conductance mechanosensitive channel
MLAEFKKFILKGNVVDLAVGIIIGSAFGAVVNSFVNDIITPPIGLLLGKMDFSNLYVLLQEGKPAGPYETLAAAREAGAVTLNLGLFINTTISLLIVGFAMFLLVRAVNRMEKPVEEKAPAVKNCPYCCTEIPQAAKRCPHCTSELEI